jgi:hypothetical protein
MALPRFTKGLRFLKPSRAAYAGNRHDAAPHRSTGNRRLGVIGDLLIDLE